MKLKKYAALLLAFIIFAISLSGCSLFGGDDSTTAAPVTTDQPASYYTEPSSVADSTQPVTSAPEETTVPDNFAFSPETAQELGVISSEIYGRLTVYYQDDRIALLDDFDALLFVLDAQGLSPVAPVKTQPGTETPSGTADSGKTNGGFETIACDDMNFDGYSDLRILYRETSFNAFYLCWMWDMQNKTYTYYEPLSSIPTPSFERNSRTVVSLNKTSRLSASLTSYEWQDGELYPIDHRIIYTEEETVPGSDDVDRGASITDGLALSYIVLNCTDNSNSRWICKVENENTVSLIGDTYNEMLLTHKFIFKGIAPGTTTVVFRYAISWTSDYVAEKVFNITVNGDKTLSITEVK